MIAAERVQHVTGGGKPRPYTTQTYTNWETTLNALPESQQIIIRVKE